MSKAIKRIFLVNTFNTNYTFKKSNCGFPLQVKSGVQNAHVLQGKIVTLGIQCGSDRHGYEFQGCLMFKLLGQQTCGFSSNYYVIC